jgi:hypothetical protein
VNITQHPFAKVGISVRSTKSDVATKMDNFSVRSGAAAAELRAALNHPARRVELEVSWFPGLSPARTERVYELLGRADAEFDALPELPALCRFNCVVYWLTSRPVDREGWEQSLAELDQLASLIDLTELQELINADRVVAGYPPVQTSEIVGTAFHAHIDLVARDVTRYLKDTPRCEVLLGNVVNDLTFSGSEQCGDFLYKIVDLYQLEMQNALSKYRHQLDAICGSLKAVKGAPIPRNVSDRLDLLEGVLRGWDALAQPIQLARMSQGRTDDDSLAVGRQIRSLAIDLANEYGFHAEAKRLLTCLRETHEEVHQITDRTEEDLQVLDDVLERKELDRLEEEERRNELTGVLSIGKDKLMFSPDYVEFMGKRLSTESITRMRWGIFKHYVNGIRSSREFTVWIGDRHQEVRIECVRFMESEEVVFARFIDVVDKVWKLAGIRLLMQMTNAMMNGAFINYGSTRVTKDGMWLQKRSFFRAEPYFAGWEDLAKSNQGGMLTVSASREPSARVELSLRDVENAVILDRLLDYLWKDGNYLKLRNGTLFE